MICLASFEAIVKPKGRCNVVGCRGKLNAKDVSTENICKHHLIPVGIRMDNMNLTCCMRDCLKKARSSGYCSKHSPDEYVQRADLLPENGFGDEDNPLYRSFMKAAAHVIAKDRTDEITRGRRR